MRRETGSSVARYLPAVVVWIFTAGFLALTYQLPPSARATPSLVGWITLALATLDILSRTGGEFGPAIMRAVNPAGLKARPEMQTHTKTDLVAGIGLIAILVGLFIGVGVILATAIFTFGALTLAYRSEFLRNATIAAAATLGVWLLFGMLLRLQLYPGLAFGGVL
jgi:hypothetical protein